MSEKISEDKVKHIAELARIELSEEETREFQQELSSILDYIDKLKELDVTDVEPTRHSTVTKNVMREDEVEKENSEVIEKIKALAPKLKQGYVKVKSILN